jgi:uncharacterized protein (TIGR00369 family)
MCAGQAGSRRRRIDFREKFLISLNETMHFKEIFKMSKISEEKAMEVSMKSNSAAYDYMGLCIEQASDGIFRASIPHNKNTTNHFNGIHAALQFAVAECLGGLVWRSVNMSKGYVIVVRDVSINFKRPALSAISAQACFSQADVEKLKNDLAADGRCDYLLPSEIKDESGQIVSKVVANYAIRSADKLKR